MDIGPWEIAIIAVVVLVLFGSKKLPDAARSLGRSMRILKTEIKSMHDDDSPSELPAAAPAVAPVPPAAAPVAAPVPPAAVTTPAEPVSAGDQTTAS
jgi:sec-independent protein translocase protein TatA